MKNLAALLFMLLMAPINAFVQAATLSKLWQWFISNEYGSGPSYGAWYGICVIFNLMLGLAISNLARKKDDSKESPAFRLTVGVLMPAFTCALTLLFSFAIGNVTGFIK